MKFDPVSKMQELKQFGEFSDNNPSITGSSTFTFLKTDKKNNFLIMSWKVAF